jgi:hypothetical protein
MGDIGSAIKYLYEKFILRDVLSFVTPGAIIVVTAFYLLFPNMSSFHIPWPFYVPLFGLFFVLGFAVQCFGEMFGFLHFYRDIRSSRSDRCKVWGLKWHELPNRLNMQEKMKELLEFWRATERDEEARQGRERLVVFKQMCVNNFLAFIISGIFLGVSFCNCKAVHFGVLSFVAFLLTLSLFWGYRVHVLRQDAREQVIIEEYRKVRGQ